jgi:hypothetical protein
MAHAVKMFAHNVKAGFGQEVVDIGNPSVERILHGNDGEIGFAFANGDKRILECGARHSQRLRERFARSQIGIGARFTLKRHAMDVRS